MFCLLSASLGSLTGVGNLTLTPEQEQKITIMEQLYGLCVQGKQCCRRVLTAKKIALVSEYLLCVRYMKGFFLSDISYYYKHYFYWVHVV